MGKNLFTRVAVALITIPVILYFVYLGKLYFLVLIGLISTFSMYEILNIGKIFKLNLNSFFGIFCGSLIILEMYFFGLDYLFCLLILFLLILLVSILISASENPFFEVGYYLFSFIYVPIFLGCLILIRENEILEYYVSGKLIIAVLGIIWTMDTMAYFIGSKTGKHKLYPRISPKKSVEGAIAGIFGGYLFMFIAKYTFLHEIELYKFAVLTGIIVVFGQVGDFVESLLKRKAEIKDSSDFLLGHGGFLDRFDSLIFTSPLIYLVFKVFF